MADVNKLVFSIIRFLQDQKTNNSLDEDKVESIEGTCILTCRAVMIPGISLGLIWSRISAPSQFKNKQKLPKMYNIIPNFSLFYILVKIS